MPAIPESHLDLLEAQVATLATVGPDGRPQLSEVWFLADNGTIRISLNTSRQKSKNLRRNPACTLLVLDLDNPQRYLEVRADARIEPDKEYAFADRVGAKYGADLRVHDQPGQSRMVVELVPVRINAVDMSA
jgi:PPOX class probable F420-dependent enzyme